MMESLLCARCQGRNCISPTNCDSSLYWPPLNRTVRELVFVMLIGSSELKAGVSPKILLYSACFSRLPYFRLNDPMALTL